MRRKRLRAVIFGPQGAGKSLQALLLSERFSVPFITSGKAFREEMAEKSALGDLAKEYVDAGMFAPDELANAILARTMKRVDLEKGFVIDGYPRNVEQAETLDRIAKVTLAIQLKIADDTSVKRLGGRLMCRACRAVAASPSRTCEVCGEKLLAREKDKEETVRRRLAAYHFMTEPLSGYYRQRGVLLAVNAEQSAAELTQELIRKLAKLGFVA
ncbi:MAG: nucleoside monophosphate kinase [Candidatus Uhrbacteria bacterium]